MGYGFYDLGLALAEMKPSKFTYNIDDTARTKVYTMDIPGVDADKVTITKNWINRIERLTLDVVVDKGNDEFDEESIVIDTDTYNKYSYVIENGRITITLHEIINPEPEFELV